MGLTLRPWALAVSVVALGACSSPPVARTPPPTTEAVAVSTSTSTTAPPVNPVGWLPCRPYQCGTVAVPLDYAHPQARTIGIFVERHPASDPAARLGSLVINPGGPGDSGVDDLPAELRVLTPDLLARFDIVSFDPRGVGRSQPVRCGPAGPSTPGPVPDPVPQTPAATNALVAANRAYANACEQASGDLLPFVGTVDAARDLDRIRAALGDARLTFIGHSYGTLLGETYAELFAPRVRAMVLDGVIDPSLTTAGMSAAQAVGFDASFNAFASWCATTPACAWRPGGDAASAFLRLVATARAHPLPAAGERVTGPGEVYLGALGTLYARSFWPSLGRALAAASRGDGGPLLGLSDSYQTHGSSNAADANSAITCLDHPVPTDPSAYAGLAADAAQQAPIFGPLFSWGALQCAVWPANPTRTPHPIRAPGSPPILVVGTTGDPATPYAWAENVARQLEHGVLVGRRGIDHVAYYYSSCVRTIDAQYLIAGTLPASGTICPA